MSKYKVRKDRPIPNGKRKVRKFRPRSTLLALFDSMESGWSVDLTREEAARIRASVERRQYTVVTQVQGNKVVTWKA